MIRSIPDPSINAKGQVPSDLQWRIQGVAMVLAETPLKERTPLISDDWYREEQKLWLVC